MNVGEAKRDGFVVWGDVTLNSYLTVRVHPNRSPSTHTSMVITVSISSFASVDLKIGVVGEKTVDGSVRVTEKQTVHRQTKHETEVVYSYPQDEVLTNRHGFVKRVGFFINPTAELELTILVVFVVVNDDRHRYVSITTKHLSVTKRTEHAVEETVIVGAGTAVNGSIIRTVYLDVSELVRIQTVEIGS